MSGPCACQRDGPEFGSGQKFTFNRALTNSRFASAGCSRTVAERLVRAPTRAFAGAKIATAKLARVAARGGIEPPTRGFSVPVNLHPTTPNFISATIYAK